jgi:hypothetical protein
LSGKKVSLPAAAGGQSAVLIIGFTLGSRAQTKAWSLRVRGHFQAWSIAVVEGVPSLLRGMVTHSIMSGTPREQYDRFVLVYHGEKQLSSWPDSTNPVMLTCVIDKNGAIAWRFSRPRHRRCDEAVAANLRTDPVRQAVLHLLATSAHLPIRTPRKPWHATPSSETGNGERREHSIGQLPIMPHKSRRRRGPLWLHDAPAGIRASLKK